MNWLITIAILLFGSALKPAYASQVADKGQLDNSHSVAKSQSLQKARQFYEAGRLNAAEAILQQAIAEFGAIGDVASSAKALRNLALIYQQQGSWTEAASAIAEAREIVPEISNLSEQHRIYAGIIDVRGQLELSRGQPEAALASWQEAAEIYESIGNVTQFAKNQIYQAQGLQTLGLYAQAIATLTQVRQTLEQKPNTLLKAKALQSIGDVLRRVGNYQESRLALEDSLAIAEKHTTSPLVADILLSLGDTVRLQQQPVEALLFYQRAIDVGAVEAQIGARLRQLSLLIDKQQDSKALSLIAPIEARLAVLPPSQTATTARINLARNLLNLSPTSHSTQIVTHLSSAIELARSGKNRRAESEALGTLGELYERHQRFDEARELTQKALAVAQAVNAADLAYQWQWQLGRLLQAEGERQGAIAAYSQAVNTLESLRGDLVAISSQMQFSFREQVEPVYRELVGLLLKPGATQDNLQLARETVESLQLAQLDNFFRDACLDANPVEIERLDPTAAIIYPIILEDRLEVIAAIPGRPLRHYTTNLPQAEIEKNLLWISSSLNSPRRYPRSSLLQQPYDWLVAPIAAELVSSDVNTLVFVPDGVFRNLPPTILHDGEGYLVEKYNLAIAPSLQLVAPQPLASEERQLLLAGLTKARQGFSPLPGVNEELQQIDSQFSARVLLNDTFTESNFNQVVDRGSFQIIHLATHGKFSSSIEDTFVLTWDERIDINELNRIIRADPQQLDPIELLVLSACETAAGDRQAALGLAGIAVRSGARSTLASLWAVSDRATGLLMSRFYGELNGGLPKAEALRRAQQAVMQDERFSHPYYWSAFILVGNWL